MNKHTAIAIAASFVIAVPFMYAGANIVSLEQLELRSPDHGRFSMFEFSSDRTIEVCNALPFFTSFDLLTITVMYYEDPSGVYTVQSRMLEPSSLHTLNGTFTAGAFPRAQSLFLHIDGAFMDIPQNQVNLDQLYVVFTIQTSILNVIPYHITTEHSIHDFYDLMNASGEEFSC